MLISIVLKMLHFLACFLVIHYIVVTLSIPWFQYGTYPLLLVPHPSNLFPVPGIPQGRASSIQPLQKINYRFYAGMEGE